MANGRATSAAMFTTTNCSCGTLYSRGFCHYIDFMTTEDEDCNIMDLNKSDGRGYYKMDEYFLYVE
jgi:hypothetical protein